MRRGASERDHGGAGAREAKAVSVQDEVEIAVLELDDVELIVLGLEAEAAAPELTRAEQEVVRLVLDGCSNREIAQRRNASVKTVANQLMMIYRKLGIVSRFELAARVGGSSARPSRLP
jgi:DNA-binding CsgD family transcriptional regulator